MFPMATGHHRKHWTPTTTPGPSTSGRIVLDNFSGRRGRRGRLANSRETAAVAARPPLVGKADRRDQGIEVGAVQWLDLALIGGILQPKVVRDSLVDRDRSQDEQSTVHRAMFGGQRCCLAADLRRVLTFRCRRAWMVSRFRCVRVGVERCERLGGRRRECPYDRSAGKDRPAAIRNLWSDELVDDRIVVTDRRRPVPGRLGWDHQPSGWKGYRIPVERRGEGRWGRISGTRRRRRALDRGRRLRPGRRRGGGAAGAEDESRNGDPPRGRAALPTTGSAVHIATQSKPVLILRYARHDRGWSGPTTLRRGLDLFAQGTRGAHYPTRVTPKIFSSS